MKKISVHKNKQEKIITRKIILNVIKNCKLNIYDNREIKYVYPFLKPLK